VKIGNATSLTGSNQSSSHSPSVAGESMDVKVEITPAPPTPMSDMPTSYSIESTSSLTICSDSSTKSQVTSPHARKFSEIPHEVGGFLNPIGNFNRMNPSPNSNTPSARLFKKLEEMIDLSSPYNHYRCLSPSETNLAIPHAERSLITSPCPKLLDAGKPGSSRLLRRQFSLDKDDLTMQKHAANLETISSLVDTNSKQFNNSTVVKNSYQSLISSSSLPAASSNLISSKLHKHSASVAQDLEKIEEIPISPINTSFNSNNSNNSVKDLNSFKNSNSNNNSKTQASNFVEDGKEICINIQDCTTQD
jgi:guanylate cyclase 2F